MALSALPPGAPRTLQNLRLGEVREELNTLEGLGMEVVRKAVVRMMLTDQVQLGLQASPAGSRMGSHKAHSLCDGKLDYSFG